MTQTTNNLQYNANNNESYNNIHPNNTLYSHRNSKIQQPNKIVKNHIMGNPNIGLTRTKALNKEEIVQLEAKRNLQKKHNFFVIERNQSNKQV